MKNQLKQVREAKGLSYRTAAKQIGWSLTTLQRREAPGFDPGELTENELRAMERVYGYGREVLLGLLPVPEKEAVSA